MASSALADKLTGTFICNIKDWVGTPLTLVVVVDGNSMKEKFLGNDKFYAESTLIYTGKEIDLKIFANKLFESGITTLMYHEDKKEFHLNSMSTLSVFSPFEKLSYGKCDKI